MIALAPLLAAFTLTGGLSDSQVLQRQAGGRATPVVSGTTDQPGRLYARVGDDAWVEVASLSPGHWEVKLPALATGGPYRVELRFSDATGRALGGQAWKDVFVGDLWVLAGQSNMVGRARIEEPYVRDPRVRMLSLAGAWQPAAHPLHDEPLPPGVTRPGYGPGLEFGREMSRALDVPIGLLPCAKGGTSMAQWSPDAGGTGRNALYANLLAQVRRAGGRVSGVVWYQGENDTGPEPAALYAVKFRELVARLRADLGQPELPFLYAQLARYAADPGKFYAEWNVVREAQRLAEAALPTARMVATVDLELGDLIHLSRESQDRLGRRFAFAAQGRGGPRLAEARWTSPTEVRVRLAGVNGGLRAAGGRVFGFEAAGPDGRRKSLFFRTTIDPATGEIVLAANRDSTKRDAPEEIDLWYGAGHDPICNLTDSLDLALPAFGPVRLPPRPPAPPRAK
jgi:sialate O-acetylesterase